MLLFFQIQGGFLMHKITKAIIPVAGFGTRLFPATKVIPKAFLPIYDNGHIKPVLLKLMEELDSAGIEKICLVVNENEKELFTNFFSPITDIYFSKLKKENIIYENKLIKLGEKITYVTQKEQLGFGHAVYQSKNFAKDEPVIMILGDTLYKSNTNQSCIDQLLTYFDKVQTAIISLQEVPDEDMQYVGISKGIWDNSSKQELTLETIVEKPSVEYAHKNLLIDKKAYGNFGAFILNKEFFTELETVCSKPLDASKEYQLMDAFENLMKKSVVKGFIINGKSFDMGNTQKYQEVMKEIF